ncbi:MAG: hypothetical protein ACTSV1_00940, partial [Alphaproteobacteria bacterium]
ADPVKKSAIAVCPVTGDAIAGTATINDMPSAPKTMFRATKIETIFRLGCLFMKGTLRERILNYNSHTTIMVYINFI